MSTVNRRKIKNIVEKALKNAIKDEPSGTDKISEVRDGIWSKVFLEGKSNRASFFDDPVVKELRGNDIKFGKMLLRYTDILKELDAVENNIDSYLSRITSG